LYVRLAARSARLDDLTGGLGCLQKSAQKTAASFPNSSVLYGLRLSTYCEFLTGMYAGL
jgi:hypothetical protein